jgi:integral membrane protein
MLSKKNIVLHPITFLRILGIIDGISLLVLLGIAMPLKYWADLPFAVTIAGSIHGGIFIGYVIAIAYTQIRIQWNIGWSLLALLVAFIPFGNFCFDVWLKKNQSFYTVKPFPKLWIVYAIIMFTFIDLFTQLPVMSTYATSLGASVMVAGFVVGMYSLTNTFGNVLSGIFTDKYGVFIVLCTGLLTTSVSLLLYNFVNDVPGLIVVRFLHGFLGGLIVPAAFTYLANQMDSKKQGSQSAVTGSFIGLAAICGPAYGGIMASKTSVPFVFTTIAVVGIVLLLATLLFLRTRSGSKQIKAENREKLIFNKGILQAYTGAFFLMFSQGALAYLLPLHVDVLGYSSRLSGTLMSIFGVVAVAIFILPTNKFFDRIPPLVSFSIGLACLGISQVLLGQSSELIGLYSIMVLYGIGFAFLFPAINSLLVQSTTERMRGKAYGYFYALFSLGVVAGSSGLGLLPASITVQFSLIGIILLVCAMVMYVQAKQPKSDAVKESVKG